MNSPEKSVLPDLVIQENDSELSNYVLSLLEKLEIYNQKIQDQKIEIESLDMLLSIYRNQADLETKISQYKSDITLLEYQIKENDNHYQSILFEKDQLIENLKKENNKLMDKQSSNEKEIERSLENIRLLTSTIESLNQKNLKLSELNQTHYEAEKQLINQKETLCSQIANLQLELSNLKQKLDEKPLFDSPFPEDISSLITTEADCTEELTRLQKDVETLENFSKILQGSVSKFTLQMPLTRNNSLKQSSDFSKNFALKSNSPLAHALSMDYSFKNGLEDSESQKKRKTIELDLSTAEDRLSLRKESHHTPPNRESNIGTHLFQIDEKAEEEKEKIITPLKKIKNIVNNNKNRSKSMEIIDNENINLDLQIKSCDNIPNNQENFLKIDNEKNEEPDYHENLRISIDLSINLVSTLQKGFKEVLTKGDLTLNEIDAKISFYENEKKKLMENMGVGKGKDVQEIIAKNLKNAELMIFHLKKIKFTSNDIIEIIRTNLTKINDLINLMNEQNNFLQAITLFNVQIQAVIEDKEQKIEGERKEKLILMDNYQKLIGNKNDNINYVNNLAEKLKEIEEIDLGINDDNLQNKFKRLFEYILEERNINKSLNNELKDLMAKFEQSKELALKYY